MTGTSASTTSPGSTWPSIWPKTDATSECSCRARSGGVRKGFKGGAGYAFLTLEQFADPRDIVDVDARDITDDGKAEIFVRGVIHAAAPKDAGMKPGDGGRSRSHARLRSYAAQGSRVCSALKPARVGRQARARRARASPRRTRLRHRGAAGQAFRLHRQDVPLRPRPSESRGARAPLAPLGADARYPLPLGRRVVHQIAAEVTSCVAPPRLKARAR